MSDFCENLRRRAAILREMRSFFDARGFVEVETPVRIAAPAPEEYIDCPAVAPFAGRATDSFLRASPELQMKKLLAAGMDRLYQIGPCFREGETGSRHRPEFTMIEWYRRHATYLDILEDAERLFRALAASVSFAVRPEAFRRLAVRDAYRRFAHWDPWTAWDTDRFDYDMATCIEPAIREMGGGVFLMDYPVAAASLARVRTTPEGDFAERWELYWDGLELGNCFSELCDGVEQEARFRRAKANRLALGESDYPLDGDFLASVGLMGDAAGVALGVDRLVMTLLGEREITAVRVVD